MHIKNLIARLQQYEKQGFKEVKLENDETGKIQDFIIFSNLKIKTGEVTVVLSPKS